MDRFALKKRKKGPKSSMSAPISANPHVVRAPQAEATKDRFSTSSWLAAPPLPRQNRGSQEKTGHGRAASGTARPLGRENRRKSRLIGYLPDLRRF